MTIIKDKRYSIPTPPIQSKNIPQIKKKTAGGAKSAPNLWE